MRWRPKMAGESGFTLLEIMLAVGIGVIFMGGAAIFLSSTGGDKDLAKARSLLEEQAGVARERALETGLAQRVMLGGRGVGGQPFPDEVEMMIVTPLERSRGRSGWKTPEDYEWLFTGGGLVEPIQFLLKHGDNEVQFSFSALTGESVTEKQAKR
jgi:prepilin-type N-terminal cleavage/methylation domain-containing protein